jgi:predicted metal-dependent hydrolase
MATRINLGDIAVDVVQKRIKNIHLSVHPPTGKVRIAAPLRMDVDTIRIFAISKLDWIKKQQDKLRRQEREAPREYLDRESHYVWGKRYLLRVVVAAAPPAVELKQSNMVLRTRQGTNDEGKQTIVSKWYREQVKAAVRNLITKWAPIIGVRVERVFVQKMKTKWGSCNPETHSVRFNTELAKKPVHCLEYIVVHELVHLRERNHGDRFTTLIDAYMPQWRQYREMLNGMPLGHQEWGY